MRIAVSYTRYLNPEQVAVGGSDQPLYAIKKMIQWAMGEEFSHSYFAFMGGLHLEKVSLVCRWPVDKRNWPGYHLTFN